MFIREIPLKFFCFSREEDGAEITTCLQHYKIATKEVKQIWEVPQNTHKPYLSEKVSYPMTQKTFSVIGLESISNTVMAQATKVQDQIQYYIKVHKSILEGRTSLWHSLLPQINNSEF